MAVLRHALQQALAGHGGLVLVSGEAGIGKTALVQAFIRDAAGADVLVLRGYCYDLGTTPPYGLWQEVTDRYPNDKSLPELPEVLKRGIGVGELPNQLAVFEVALDFLGAIARERPLVLVLEDVHWADQASLDLLRYLARYLDGQRILLIATYRDDEVTRQHPLFALFPSLIRETQATRMELGALIREDVANLVTASWSLAEDDRDRLLEYLLEHAEGQPLFTIELLRTLEQSGFISPANDGWQLADLSQVPVPVLVRQVIEGRLVQLGEETRQYLEVAAVIGHQVPLELWRAVSELTDSEQISTVEHGIEANLISASAHPGQVSFSHALVREALYDGTSPPRRHLLHVRVAESMIDLGNPDPDSVSYHLQQAGDSRAPEWLVLAGERAQRSYAFKTAAERFAVASDLLRGRDDTLRERGWLLYRTARFLRYSELPRAVSLLDEAELIGRQVGDPALIAYSRFDRGAVRSDTGDDGLGFEEMRSGMLALDALPDEYLTSAEIGRWVADVVSAPTAPNHEESASNSPLNVNVVRRGSFGLWSASTGRFTDAIEIANQYVVEFETIPDPDSSVLSGYADACSALAVSYSALAQPDRAREACSIAYDVLTMIGHHNQAAMTAMRYLSRIHLLFSPDDINERHRFVGILEAFVHRAKHAMTNMACGAFVCFELLWVEAKWDSIRHHGSVALMFPSSYFRQSAALALGHLERESGNPDQAWGHVNRILPLGLESKPGESKFPFALEVQPIAANLAMDAADLDLARRWIESHDRWLAWSGAVAWIPVAELLWARYYRLAGDGSRALQHAKRCLGLASDPEQPLVLVAAHRFLGELHTELGGHREADNHLLRSLQLAESCAAPFERALTLLSLAELRVATDNSGEAAALLDEVVAICEPLRARPTLEHVATLRTRLTHRRSRVRYPAGITQREVEVLRLIVQGRSDQEISDELFISRYTVMNHVSSILRKLDVKSRTAAAAEAVRRDLA